MGQILERAEQCWSGGVEPREFWKATGVTEEIAPGGPSDFGDAIAAARVGLHAGSGMQALERLRVAYRV